MGPRRCFSIALPSIVRNAVQTGSVSVISLGPGLIDHETLEHWETMLDAVERTRSTQFGFDADRRAYITAHALARVTIAAIAHVEPRSLHICPGNNGKPALAEQPNGLDLRFSLSHCRSLVAVAVAKGTDVGVDVEIRADFSALDFDRLCRELAPEESIMLHSVTDPTERRDLSLKFWTLKEAVIKATGEGLSIPLKEFSIAFDPLRIACWQAPSDAEVRPSPWHLAHWLHDDHHIAAAVHRRAGLVRFEHGEAIVSPSDEHDTIAYITKDR